MDRKCNRCGIEKPITDFARRSADKYHKICKECNRKQYKHYYEANKKACIEASYKCTIKLRIDQRQKLISVKDVPCKDCGKSYPHYIMEFDHLYDDKLDNISNMIGKYSWKKIEEEIAKCDIVCANCHRERTFQRMAP